MQKKYEYGRIGILADKMARAGVPDDVSAQVLEGGEAIRQATSPKDKAAWMREAMHRMDRLMDTETRHAVRETCACCLGGKRLQISKSIARDHATLEARIAAANEARFVFGHSVVMQEDGSILVSFAPPGLEHYSCVCLRGADEPISITYCYCCGGHVKHHLETALGRKLALRVRSSALSSGGKRPCTFSFRLEEAPA